MGDGIIQLREKIEISLPLFEGPLDLLLRLIREQKIDIYDIPIALITEQYLTYVQLMQDLSVNVAGEFLEMAATLIYIKSRMLLPVEVGPDGEPEPVDDPRLDLVERLLEYERFQGVAQHFYSRFQLECGQWSVSRAAEVVSAEEVLVAASVFDLAAAFRTVLKRMEDGAVVAMEREEVTISAKVDHLRDLFRRRPELRLSELLTPRPAPLHLVVLFLAILEMIRAGELSACQETPFGDILLLRRAA